MWTFAPAKIHGSQLSAHAERTQWLADLDALPSDPHIDNTDRQTDSKAGRDKLLCVGYHSINSLTKINGSIEGDWAQSTPENDTQIIRVICFVLLSPHNTCRPVSNTNLIEGRFIVFLVNWQTLVTVNRIYPDSCSKVVNNLTRSNGGMFLFTRTAANNTNC